MGPARDAGPNHEGNVLASIEMGVRRRCLACNAAFYDLNRDPINCAKCGAPFTVVKYPQSAPRRTMSRYTPFAASAVLPEAEEPEKVPVDGDDAGEEATIAPRDEDDEEDPDLETPGASKSARDTHAE